MTTPSDLRTRLQASTGRLQAVRQGLDMQVGHAREVGRRGLELTGELAQLQAQYQQLERVSALLTRIGEDQQAAAQRQIEDLVTRALQVVFDKTLSFHVIQSVRANQPQVDFVIRSTLTASEDTPAAAAQGAPVIIDTPVMEARGGGMAVVVAFLLRLVVLLLTPGARRVLFLDESFSHVSAEYEPRLAEFLREVCDRAGVQIVMITHSTAYEDLADKHYRLELGADGITEVTAL